MSRKIIHAVLLWALVLAAPALAADYPNRPVRIVVPYPPGGSADVIGRMLADKLASSLGQPMVVENRGGASGAIGSEFVARSAPDGYTLLVALSDTHAINPAVSVHLPYDAQRDFAPISLLAIQPFMLVVGPTVTAATLADFMRQVKEQPGRLTYGSNGAGGLQHLAMVLLGTEAGGAMLHVPYRGAGPALADVMAGHLDTIFISVQGAGSNLGSNRLRPLAVTSPTRLAAVPDVPTFAESGYAAFQVSQWYGLMAPRGTPPDILQRLNEHVVAAMRALDVVDKLRAAGTEPVGGTADEFRDFLANQIDQWAGVAKAHDIRIE